jgi:hypothetical protein
VTEIELDRETTRAVEALAYRIRERDAAVRSDTDVADADVMALEFITAFRGQGWRPTLARKTDWQAHPSATAAPADISKRAAMLAEAKAACDEATARKDAAARARDAS